MDGLTFMVLIIGGLLAPVRQFVDAITAGPLGKIARGVLFVTGLAPRVVFVIAAAVAQLWLILCAAAFVAEGGTYGATTMAAMAVVELVVAHQIYVELRREFPVPDGVVAIGKVGFVALKANPLLLWYLAVIEIMNIGMLATLSGAISLAFTAVGPLTWVIGVTAGHQRRPSRTVPSIVAAGARRLLDRATPTTVAPVPA